MKKEELNNLMQKIQQDDEQSFNVFYQDTYKGVFSFIYSYVKNWHTAEDLLQETYIKIKLNAGKYKIGSNAVAWVLEIAKNTCKDYIRKESLRKTEELNENVLESKTTDITKKLYYHDLLNKSLKDGDRQIVLLHLIFGYKNREIAKILGIPIGTVLWKYNKLIKQLKNKIKED